MVAHLATSGHYGATLGAVSLGRTEEGHFMEITHKGEILTFEEFADNAIDMVNRGTDVTVEMVLKEWTAAGLQTALWPYSTTFGKMDCSGEFAVLGGYALPLVLTAASCAPAASDGPATITFHKAIMEPDVASRINFNNKPRMIPMRFKIFLSEVTSGNFRYFTVT